MLKLRVLSYQIARGLPFGLLLVGPTTQLHDGLITNLASCRGHGQQGMTTMLQAVGTYPTRFNNF